MKLFTLASIFFLLFIIGVSEVKACKCKTAASVCNRLEEIKKITDEEAIFVGTPISVKKVKITYKEEGEETEEIELNKYEFQVDETLAGKIGKSDFVLTSSEGASCGYPFEIGRKYLVYANTNAFETYSTSLCSGNKEFENAVNEIQILRELKQTGSVKPKIFGKANFILDKQKDVKPERNESFKISARRKENNEITERTVESGNFFEFANLSFGEFWFTVSIKGVEAKISQPIVLDKNNLCQEVNISADEKVMNELVKTKK